MNAELTRIVFDIINERFDDCDGYGYRDMDGWDMEYDYITDYLTTYEYIDLDNNTIPMTHEQYIDLSYIAMNKPKQIAIICKKWLKTFSTNNKKAGIRTSFNEKGIRISRRELFDMP